DAQGVAVVDVVVDERGGQVVRGPDRVDVARQVEVEVLHRDDLAAAAARGAALDAEHGPEARLADAHRRLLADAVQALGEPDRRRGLALAEGCRADGRDEDVLAPRVLRLEALDALERDLGLDRAVQLDLLVAEPEVVGDLNDRARLDGAGDFEVGQRARGHRPGGRRNAPRDLGGAHASKCSFAWSWRCAARIRWLSNSAPVSGPTPPGTGVIADATFSALSKSTSPTMCPWTTLMPTSMTTAPGLSIAAVTRPGLPAATTTMSARRTLSA